uniref:Uncharacterized protein n=1 Tax=Anopheles melas TaxID=34690 RepID=A0A182TZQ3_9DIPT
MTTRDGFISAGKTVQPSRIPIRIPTARGVFWCGGQRFPSSSITDQAEPIDRRCHGDSSEFLRKRFPNGRAVHGENFIEPIILRVLLLLLLLLLGCLDERTNVQAQYQGRHEYRVSPGIFGS